MLLTPEHFEQIEARAETMLEQTAASLPFHWGVSRLAVDEAQLSQGKVVLLELEATLPDGFYVRLQRSKAEALVLLDLNAGDGSLQQQPVLLYLAVLAPTEETQGRSLRYMEAPGTQTVLTAQDEDKEEELPIPRLQPRFQLIAGVDAPSSKFVSMPLARVAVRNETWVLL